MPAKKTKKKIKRRWFSYSEKKKKKKISAGGPVPTCHICSTCCLSMRHLKEHYILFHYKAELRAQFLQGEKISKAISGQCGLCSYGGSTYSLLLHVGIVHKKLKIYLPEEVGSRLFGDQGQGVKSLSDDQQVEADVRQSLPFPESEMSEEHQQPANNLESEKPLGTGNLHNKLPLSKVLDEQPLLNMQEEGSLLACHICSQSFHSVRRIKEHYIVAHYEAEFRVKYTGGKRLSLSEKGACVLCPYEGKTRELAFHVGIAHGKLKDYLPPEIWIKLFGQQARSFRHSYDEEQQLTAQTSIHQLSSQLERRNKDYKDMKKTDDRLSRDPQTIPACHICQKQCPELRVLKKHYILAHYSDEFRAMYTGGKQLSFTEYGDCVLCPYKGKTRELAFHVGIAHGKLKDFLPSAVWNRLFGQQLRSFKPSWDEGDHQSATVTSQTSGLDSNKKNSGKKGKAGAQLPECLCVTPCHICQKRYSDLRSLKKHYILAHYSKEFRAKYTEGKRLSFKEDGHCVFCPYKGKTCLVAYHVGIFHGKLKDYLPVKIGSSLFGRETRSVKPSNDEEKQEEAEAQCTGTNSNHSSKKPDSLKKSVEDDLQRSIPRCHICWKQFPELRVLKKHYIQAHYSEEFRAKYTQGKRLSSSENVQCLLCSYSGKTRDLAFHVGMVHGRLKDFLPKDVGLRLFRDHVPKRKLCYDQEGKLVHDNTAALVTKTGASSGKKKKPAALEVRNGGIANESQSSGPEPAGLLSEATGVLDDGGVSVDPSESLNGSTTKRITRTPEFFSAAKRKVSARKSAPVSYSSGLYDEHSGILCHLCNARGRNRSALRRHYLSHYSSELYEKYCSAYTCLSNGKRVIVGDSGADCPPERCDRCTFEGRPRDLIEHLWSGHTVIKEYLPDSVWRRIRPILPTAGRTKGSASSGAAVDTSPSVARDQSPATAQVVNDLSTGTTAAETGISEEELNFLIGEDSLDEMPQANGGEKYEHSLVANNTSSGGGSGDDGSGSNKAVVGNDELVNSAVVSDDELMNSENDGNLLNTPDNSFELPSKSNNEPELPANLKIIPEESNKVTSNFEEPDKVEYMLDLLNSPPDFAEEVLDHNPEVPENLALPDCLYCTEEKPRFQSRDQLLRHLIFSHFVDNLCQAVIRSGSLICERAWIRIRLF
jgi:hypothetical protein